MHPESSSARLTGIRRLALIAAAALPGCNDGGEEHPAGGAFFVDVAAESGVGFNHTAGGRGDYYLIETMGAGGAFFDYDGDGFLDIYLADGFSLQGVGTGFDPVNLLSETPDYYLMSPPGERDLPLRLDGEADSLVLRVRQHPGRLVRNRLFRNGADDSFADVTPEAGVGDAGYGMGCAVGDYDNDGDADLYVANYGPNALYRNEGDGRFTAVTEQTGTGDRSWSVGAAFFDYDNDGLLDLYVVNYLDFHVGNNLICGGIQEMEESPSGRRLKMRRDRRSYCGPKAYSAAPDLLYHNAGTRFEDATREMVVFSPHGKGLGAVTADFDSDGDTDLYVANDGVRNFLYRNDGELFTEIAEAAGAAYNAYGRAEAGMGTDWGDFDGDADFDLFVTNYSKQTNTLYRNEGAGLFTDVTDNARLASSSFNPLGFGTFFFDADNDADLDLFVANGHVKDRVGSFAGNEDITYAQPNQLFDNLGGREYVDVSGDSGPGLEPVLVSRGSAFGDYDNDGDLDVLVTNCNGPAQLLRNDLPARRNWLSVRLVGSRGNRDAVGSRIAVTCGGATQIREVRTNGSYASASDIRQHFGLGGCSRVERLEIIWHDGSLQVVGETEANRFLTIAQEG